MIPPGTMKAVTDPLTVSIEPIDTEPTNTEPVVLPPVPSTSAKPLDDGVPTTVETSGAQPPTDAPAPVVSVSAVAALSHERRSSPVLPPGWPLLIALVALVAVALVGVLHAVSQSSPIRHVAASTAPTPSPSTRVAPLATPARIGSLGLLQDSATIRSQMQAAFRDAPIQARANLLSALDHAAFGGYVAAGRKVPSMMLVAFRIDDLPAIRSMPPSAIVTNGLTGDHLIAARSYPAGPHGGALSCGQSTTSGTEVNACAWADGKTVGFMISLPPRMTPAQLASLTNAGRALLEK